MAINVLTDQDCKKAVAGEKIKKLFDGFGMFLAILPSGTKSWRMSYRDSVGKPQTQTIGPYPLITLADARKRRDAIRLKLLDGVDLKFKEKPTIDLSTAVKTYWGGREDVGTSYISHAVSALDTYIERYIGKTPINAVTRDQVMELLMKMNADGKFVYVKKVKMWLSQVFEWAVQQGHCKDNPIASVNSRIAFGRRPVKGFQHLPLKDVHQFMERVALEGDLQSVMANKLLALTWLRTGELRRVKWVHIEGNMLRLPASVMTKGKREHLVPLSTQALKILAELKLRCRNSEFILPCYRDIKKPMSENEVLALIQRVGYKDRMTGHGWRKVGSTWANEQFTESHSRRFDKDHIETQLSHTDGTVRGVYNSAEYYPQRVEMLQAFADWLDKPFVSNNANASVVQGA